ncbi:WW domain-binding protein 2-like [Lytechinus variegatus]|uniref:WW domain-binding protein 2-like n=1 Tax=Lytechinus variegatus TaxID=7654 RepID=UPI001BB2C669|nr:WW domain-binding protein 2-like [Lytechinus variegatus]
MSLNTANTKDGSLVLQGDRVILVQDGVEASFEMSPMVDHFKGTKKGKVYLTSLVMAFVPTKSGLMKSLAVPFTNLKNLEIKQPLFGANYLSGNIQAQPGGGFEGQVKFKMIFNNGGAIDMAQGLMRAVKRAQNAPRPASAPNAAPQMYPAPYPGGHPQAPPQPGYQNGGAYYPPPQGGMYQQPYPPPGAAYPPGQPMQPPPPYYGNAPPNVGTAPPQPAYWDPNSQNVYIPQAEPTAPPPPYTEKSKTD